MLAAIWGSSYALIKIAVDAGMPPVWVAFWRCAFGALALWAVLVVGRLGAPRGKVWAYALIAGLAINTLPFTLLAFGETHVSSILAGLLTAMTPLCTLLFSFVLLPNERPTPRRVIAIVLGLTGVLTIVGVWNGVGNSLWTGSLAVIGATACYGFGFAYIRRFMSNLRENSAALATTQVTCSTLVLLVLAPVFAGRPQWPGLGPAAALLVLGALGTGVAYILNFYVIRSAGSTVASTVTYIGPIFATLIGVTLLSESIHWNTIVGALIVIAGVSLNQAQS